MIPPATPLQRLHNARQTLTRLQAELESIYQELASPPRPPPPASPDATLMVPGSAGPTQIVDSHHNTWTITFNHHQAPTLALNGHPDPLTSPVAVAYYLQSRLYYQRLTGQWFLWDTNHWLPVADPRGPGGPDTSQWHPSTRADEATSWSWVPPSPGEPTRAINWELLSDLFTDNSHLSDSFSPGPLPVTLRPRSTPVPPIYQRSDGTWLLPLVGLPTAVTYQFPGLKPTFLRLWDGIQSTGQAPGPTKPVRLVTGTDTIAVPNTSPFFILEISLS